MSKPAALAPGSTIGIVGGGQLGRMMSVQASKMGYQVHIYSPEADSPAAEVSKFATVAAYDDEKMLAEFCKAVDVVTLEFENIPLSAAKFIEANNTLHPSSRVLEICQHRVKEKKFVSELGIETAPFAPATTLGEAKDACEAIGFPCVLKTCTMGYDGKGQAMVKSASEVEAAWAKLNSDDVIIEGFVPFVKEASVVVTRDVAGHVLCFPLVENVHKNHILHQTIAPAEADIQTLEKAEEIALRIAEALDLVGILAVELFVMDDGTLKVNEMAPRPHNSGHWTIEACQVSQFEQAIRAAAGLPLAAINQHSRAVMTNLIGDDVNEWLALASKPKHTLHLYGKKEVKPGRKMGHVTQLVSTK